MNPYIKQCNEYIREYNLERNDFIDSVQIHNIILGLLQKKCLQKNVALWGAGYSNSLTSHAAVLLTKYATCLQGVSCLIDSCKELQGKMFMGRPIISPEELKDRNIDVVIVSSRSSAESIKKSLAQFGPNCECLDIYQELRNEGIDIHYNFYEERNFYSELYEVRIAYEQASDEDKARLLWKLIASYLYIHDFYYAFHYIDEYVENAYPDSDKIAECKTKIQELIQIVSNKNRQRKGDITLHYIDALRAVDVLKKDKESAYQVLDEYLRKAAVFTDIHSTAPTTYESVYSITTGELPFKENVYENRFIFAPDEFPIMKKAMDMKYDCNLYSSGEWRILSEDSRVTYYDQIHMTDKLWTLACNMADASCPTFNYVYYPWELHFPLLCGYHCSKPVPMGFKDVGIVDMSGFIENQLHDCLLYMDAQFAFYNSIFPQDEYKVIFSDHSQIVYDPDRCVPFYCYAADTMRSTHCVMAIKGPGIPHKEFDELASLIDFNRIVDDFIWKHSYELPKHDVIRYQYYSTHNKQFRDVAKEQGLTDYIDGMQCFKSKKYIYIQTQTGVKEVFKADDPKHNIMDTAEGQAFVKQIEEHYEISFPEFLVMHY